MFQKYQEHRSLVPLANEILGIKTRNSRKNKDQQKKERN